MQFGHEDVVKILQEYEQSCSPQASQTDAENRSRQSKCLSLEGVDVTNLRTI